MGSIGCPLCCRHEFMSVSALHDHLLYYTYRPLRCAVCGSNAAGIQELIHHLEQHVCDNIAGAVQKAASVAPQVCSSETDENLVEESHRPLQDAVINKEYLYGSRDAPGNQNQEFENLIGRDEPVELTLRAYVCPCCGAKVVGKDKYFFHIKQHNSILNPSSIQAAPSITLSAPQSISCESEMGPDSNYIGDSGTPNIPGDQEAIPTYEPDPFDKAFPDCHNSSSNYIDENDTATQLLKLREWQLEKHGKRFKRHIQNLTKSPCPSESSSVQGRRTSNRNSPVMGSQRPERTPQSLDSFNYSLERQPLSHSSYASSIDFEQSQSIYKQLPIREDTNSTNLIVGTKTPSIEAQNNWPENEVTNNTHLDIVSGTDAQNNGLSPSLGSQREKDLTIPNAKQEVSKTDLSTSRYSQESIEQRIIENESQVGNYIEAHKNGEHLLSQNFKPLEKYQPIISSYQVTEHMNSSVNIPELSAGPKDNLGASVVSSQHNHDLSTNSYEAVCETSNRDQMPTVIQPKVFQNEATCANSVPNIGTSLRGDVQQCEDTEMNACFPMATNFQESLQTFNESSNCSANSEVDIEPSVLVTDSWIEPHTSAQYLELKPPSKTENSTHNENSISKENIDILTPKPLLLKSLTKTSKETENQDNSLQGELSKQNCIGPIEYNVSRELLQKSDCETSMKVSSMAQNDSLLETCIADPHSSRKLPANKEYMHSQLDLDEIENDPQDEDSNYIQYNTGKAIESDICENDSFPSHSGTSLPYLHKKFHHDQERKVASTSGGGQRADLFRYIHNFQSLLVSRLNGTFSLDTSLKSRTTSIDNNVKQKDESSDHTNTKPQKQQNKDLVCEVCNFECTDAVQLNLHYKNHEQGDQKSFKCKFCKLSFFKKSSKDCHEKKHTAKKVYRCSQCQQVFNKLYILNRHLKEVHAVKRPFHCNDCGKDFTTSRHFQNHIGVHQAVRQHKCNQCKHSCHTASGLRTHIMEVHSGPRDRSFSCKVCGEKFVKQYGLKRHIERKHTDGTLSCEICSKSFSCNEDLIKHTKSHEGNMNISCEHCDQVFTSTWSLQRHSMKHQAENKQFKCSKCPKSFTRKDSLTTHEKLHAHKKNYVCKCGKRFVRKSQLTAHEDKHSNVPKYSCNICKHSYKFKISLKNHSCKPKVIEDVLQTDQGDQSTN